jgi:hypothetical protein
MVDEPDALVFETPDDPASSIGRAVVDDQDLEGKRGCSQELTQLTERVGDSARFIEGRDDDRDFRPRRVARADTGRLDGICTCSFRAGLRT